MSTNDMSRTSSTRNNNTANMNSGSADTTMNSSSHYNTNTNNNSNSNVNVNVNANVKPRSNSNSNSKSNSSTKSKRSSQAQHVVGIHYALGSKIGEGSFGVIFEGVDLLNTKQNVAIKFEPRKSEAPQLRDEFRSYKILNNCKGIPQAYYYGQEGMHNVLVLDLLGPSLEDLFEWCGRKFSVKTTVLLAKQMIERLKDIHNRDLIYRDIKPDNFLISQYQRYQSSVKKCCISSKNDPNLVYVVDFGMAKQYRDPSTKQHIPYRERKSLSGTARYMSINTHLGREQSRRDDLESLGHVFFYFLRGSLPWQGLKAPNNKLKYEKIGHTKQASSPEFLCMNGKFPKQFGQYLQYCRTLKFDEEPNYDYLIGLMDSVLEQSGQKDDQIYDWMSLNDGYGWDIRINKRSNLHGYGGAQNNNNNNHNNNNNSNQNNVQYGQTPQQSAQQQRRASQQLSTSNQRRMLKYQQQQAALNPNTPLPLQIQQQQQQHQQQQQQQQQQKLMKLNSRTSGNNSSSYTSNYANYYLNNSKNPAALDNEKSRMGIASNAQYQQLQQQSALGGSQQPLNTNANYYYYDSINNNGINGPTGNMKRFSKQQQSRRASMRSAKNMNANSNAMAHPRAMAHGHAEGPGTVFSDDEYSHTTGYDDDEEDFKCCCCTNCVIC
ncbi:hypothetical protein ACO0QE_004407 [Hanseniaspora vineae]